MASVLVSFLSNRLLALLVLCPVGLNLLPGPLVVRVVVVTGAEDGAGGLGLKGQALALLAVIHLERENRKHNTVTRKKLVKKSKTCSKFKNGYTTNTRKYY